MIVYQWKYRRITKTVRLMDSPPAALQMGRLKFTLQVPGLSAILPANLFFLVSQLRPSRSYWSFLPWENCPCCKFCARVSPFFLFLFYFLSVMSLTPLVLQWNIRSVRANGQWLRSSPELQARVICLQETFLTSSDVFSLPNMVIFRADRAASRGGGLLTAVACSLPSYLVPLPPCPFPDFEALGVNVFVNQSWIFILNIYSPSGCFPGEWLSEVLGSTVGPTVLLGDFNINLLYRSPPFPPRLQLLTDWVSNQDLCILNMDHPTRFNPSGASSLLDLTLVSPELLDGLNFYVHPDLFDSDHHPILLLTSTIGAESASHRRSPNWAKAGLALNSMPALPRNSYQEFESCCTQIIKDTSSSIRRTERSRRPWWDSTCRQLLVLKRKHLRLARTLCSKDNWIKYKKFSAKLRRYAKQAARRYWDNFCQESCSTSRIFKLLRSLSAKDSLPGDNVIRNPDPLASAPAQARAFLSHFARESSNRPLPYDLSDGDSSLDASFTLDELNFALQHSRPTTPGADGISVRLLKTLSTAHRQSLLGSLNESFISGVLPPSWKTATVIPIRKPGKPGSLLSSYRPIALTSAGCKVLERMILRRLITWTGQRQIFKCDQFGFIPTRDCTVALCTLTHDIIIARSKNWFVAAICLDIKAAYDSVSPDILIYKLASLGIKGKTGLWIASFVTGRNIQVRWKSVLSPSAPCNLGVPQGSVLSPFLFNIYMTDVFDTLEEGVQMMVYADDILVYVTGPDEIHSRRKLHDTLCRIQSWCEANELSISPTKCSAINFSRRRDSGDPIKLLGVDIPWSSPVKILGIWFTKSLNFASHFSAVKLKAFRRLNYLKAVTSRSRGVDSSHMLRLVNSLVRSLLEYGAPLFFDAPRSSLRILEVCYNAALRVASGLPSWTPLPVLRRETGSSSMSSRLIFLTKLFLLRLLSAPPGLRLGEVVRSVLASPIPNWKWWPPLRDLQEYIGWPLEHVLRLEWPPVPGTVDFRVVHCGLTFQDTSLPDSVIVDAWHLWYASLPPCSFYATDASKDNIKTAIAAVDLSSNCGRASLVSNVNTVFTAEALAVSLALSSLSVHHPEIFIMSDSLAVLRALDSWSLTSPKVILNLLSLLRAHYQRGHRITFVWCPGHKGIPPNEWADQLAKNGPFACSTMPWISSDDLRAQVRKAWKVEMDYAWINSDYATSHPHLQLDRFFPKWVPSRALDVLMARWRARTVLTHHRLYRMNLTFSPLCRDCYDVETPDHILLSCPRLSIPRRFLFDSLGISSSATYSDVLTAAFRSHRTLAHFIVFSRHAFPDVK